MNEPLDYLDRAKLQATILKNIEREIMQLNKANKLRAFWEMSPNWVRVQAFINGNTRKAGSTSSAEQCEFIGLDPDSRTLLREMDT
jgi:hypothetical protein